MNVSYSNLGVYTNKETGEICPVLPKNGSQLQVVDLKKVWLAQERMDPVAPKGVNGMIFPFSFTTFYPIDYIKEQQLCNNGLLFIDIDCGKEYIDRIYDAVPECNERMNGGILGAARTGKGIHLLFITTPRTAEEFPLAVFYRLAAYAWIVKEVTGVDLRDVQGALDGCTFSFKQRLFLRYSKDVFWNDNAQMISFGVEDKERLKKEYNELYNRANPTRHRSLDPTLKRSGRAKVIEIHDVGMQEYLEHKDRWRLFDSLCCCFIGESEEELWRQWDRCAKLIDPKNHSTKWFIDEPRKNNWLKMWMESNSQWYDRGLLLKYGYVLGDEHCYWQPITGDVTNVMALMGLDLSVVPKFN